MLVGNILRCRSGDGLEFVNVGSFVFRHGVTFKQD